MTRTGTLILLSLLVLSGSSFAREIDSRGTYGGFFQSTQNPGLWGLMQFQISDVKNHRFTGALTMLVGGQAGVPFSVDGTVSTSGEFTGNGTGPGGRVQFHGQIEFLDGGAAIADSSYFFMPGGNAPPDPDRGTATLLRNFNTGDATLPLIGGHWDGLGTSSVDGSVSAFHLDVDQSCTQGRPGTAFAGIEIIDPEMKFIFQGSVNGDGRFAVIGWSFTNDRFIVTGNYEPPPDPDKPATATANYVLMFGNGFTDRGTFTMSQVGSPPDPCRIIIGQ